MTGIPSNDTLARVLGLLDPNCVSNLSAIRRLALSILRRDTTSKIGANNKRFKAALDPNDILEVLKRPTV